MSGKKQETELPVIHMEDMLNKHLEKMKLTDAEKELFKSSMQEVWYEEFFSGSFIELPEGMVLRFNEELLDDKEQNILYRKLIEEECYENTDTLERYAFGKVRSVSLRELVEKIIPVYTSKLVTMKMRNNMAQA